MRGAAVVIFVATVSTAFGKPADKDPLLEARDELRKVEATHHYVEAVELAKKYVELATKLHGADSKQQIEAREDLARDLERAGEHSRALREEEALVALAEKQHGADSKEVLYALESETIPLGSLSRHEEVAAIQERMLAIGKKVYGADSQDYLRLVRNHASTLSYQRNEYSEALRLYEEALKIAQHLDPATNAEYAATLELAGAYWQTNQRPRAIELYNRAIELAEKAPRATPHSIADALWIVASAYHYSKRDDLAKPLIERGLALYDKEAARLEKEKPDDWELSSLYSQGAAMLRQLGRNDEAKQHLRRAIELDDKRNGNSTNRLMLADLEHLTGNYKEALALYATQAAWIAKAIPLAASEYNMQMARVLIDLRDYKRAEKLLLERLAWADKEFGKHHQHHINVQMQLGLVYQAAGNVAGAERAFDDAFGQSERALDLALQIGTDRDHALYFASHAYLLDVAVNFNAAVAPKSSGAARLALTTVLRLKGRLLDTSAAALATLRKKLSPEDKLLLDQLADARSKLSNASVAGHPDEKQIAVLEDQIQKLELELGKRSAAYRAASAPIELAAVQKQIPADARLVEIVSYVPSDPKHTQQFGAPAEPRRYAAYVLGHTGDPKLVELASAADLDSAVETFRKAVADPDNDRAGELGHALYTLTMGKLAPALGGATHVLIAADGALNVVPFAALVDDKGKFLVETYTFTYLTSGRDLLRLAVKTKAQGGGIVIADPSFDASAPARAGSGSGSRGSRSLDFTSLSWPALPGTAKEADAVAKTWKGLRVLRGTDATEGALKAVKGPKILHLATHGFFLPDEAEPVAGSNEARENPLLRSGLALAGANKLVSGDEDGILTALEASGLDLEGTKLVVLSACETGVGKVTNGDGVYGLRRALVIAGAESLVMSLWQVDDEATKELMVGYYARLAQGKSRSAALHDVQLELMARPRYKHPYYWASFLAAGDESPIRE